MHKLNYANQVHMGAGGGEDEALSTQPVGGWGRVGNILLKEIQCTSSWKGSYGIDTHLLSMGSVPSLSVLTLALSCTLEAEEVKESGCLAVGISLFMVSSQ